MRTTKVGSRGVVFTFDDLTTEDAECPTNVYVINGNKHVFICDTFLGPDSMSGVKDYIEKHFGGKPIVIFNSHYDYDHHWGNCAFVSDMILSHSLCKTMIEKHGLDDLEKQKKWLRGEVKIVLPTTVFEEKYDFEDEGVHFFHTPGHTEDSASCYDCVDEILFVGDNIEEPIPYIRTGLEGIKIYIETVKNYLSYSFKTLIPGHGPITDRSLLDSNLSYLEHFPELKDPINLKVFVRNFYHIHLHNLTTLADEYLKSENKEEAIQLYNKFIAVAIETKAESDEVIERIKTKVKEIK
ncbi:MAG: MBL fold metallo-hydrolase [Candidatus Heimdallarchaeota archaeon]